MSAQAFVKKDAMVWLPGNRCIWRSGPPGTAALNFALPHAHAFSLFDRRMQGKTGARGSAVCTGKTRPAVVSPRQDRPIPNRVPMTG